MEYFANPGKVGKELDGERTRPAGQARSFSAPSMLLLGKAAQLSVQPGLGIGPISFGGPQRDSQGLCRLRHAQAGEVSQLDELGCQGIDRFKADQNNVQSHQVFGWSIGDTKGFVEVDALAVAAVLGSALAAGLFDQDAAHGLGRGGKEMASAVPFLWLFDVH